MRKPTSWARFPTADGPRTPSITIEQKVTAIEQRDGKQVQEPDRNRQHGRQLNERDEAEARDLPRHLRDANRSAELAGRLTATISTPTI
jgi:hypothetical protein